ncbi:unnamed protein product [Paramecium pentaurelia]|uniref:Uncharacterized protein n=1 Tax=Paramecium pentaurelia TaxID=43138 RepID=A0A8S1U253_9CILI|nr:unnamed protein product [Paramecium pentaurelia]
MYHNGDKSIPPLFLVDSYGRNELLDMKFQIEMRSATQFMKHQTPIKISLYYQFPWDQMIEIVRPNSWVSSYSDELVTENGKLEKIEVKGEQIELIVAFWLQNLQLLSLRKKSSKGSLNSLGGDIKIYVQEKRVQGQQSALNQILQELRFLTSSQTLQELDEATAAQRLKIGTQIGKYHCKSLKFSIIQLQNQVDILTDPELIEEINNMIVSFLPRVGHALYLKRSDESRINPYTVEVLNIGRINKYIDSLAIIDSPNHEVEFSIGNNEKEKFYFWFHYMIMKFLFLFQDQAYSIL